MENPSARGRCRIRTVPDTQRMDKDALVDLVAWALDGRPLTTPAEREAHPDETLFPGMGKGDAARMSTHLRWHVKRDKPNPDCELCHPAVAG